MAIAQARRSLIRHGRSGGGKKGIKIYMMIFLTNHFRSLATWLSPYIPFLMIPSNIFCICHCLQVTNTTVPSMVFNCSCIYRRYGDLSAIFSMINECFNPATQLPLPPTHRFVSRNSWVTFNRFESISVKFLGNIRAVCFCHICVTCLYISLLGSRMVLLWG